MTHEGIIGTELGLPWPYAKADMKWFRNNTVGKACIVGRTTFDMLGSPLKNRKMIVLTKNITNLPKGVVGVLSADTAMKMAHLYALENRQSEIMVIGGSQVYEDMMPVVNRMYLTIMPMECKGTKLFPKYIESQWKLSYTKTEEGCRFVILDKNIGISNRIIGTID